MKYRADIDGLRAIAILAVVAYHAFPNSFKGGFVGVDVFFVISGFLITSIIQSSLSKNNFSFVDFYKRRAKRIFPALILILIACTSFGWFALLGNEYKELGKHLVSTSGFVSNLIFWREAGYFDKVAELKPLLHMWSLGIEEQFYLVWPLALWFVWKKKMRSDMMYALIIGSSLIYSLILIRTNPTAAFYSPFARFWELCLGGLLAYSQQSKALEASSCKKWRNTISVTGGAILFLGFFIIDKEKNFPGLYVLMPVVGTTLLISAGSNAVLNKYILSNQFLVGIGLISYPLYLWHWPLLSFAHILAGEAPAVEVRVLLILVSGILSWATYAWIEKPIRLIRSEKLLMYSLYILIFTVGLSGLIIFKNFGFNQRYIVQRPDNVSTSDFEQIQQYPKTTCDNDLRVDPSLRIICSQFNSTNSSRPTIILWGDSSSAAWAPVFLKISLEEDFNLILFSHASCPPLVGVKKTAFSFPDVKEYCDNLTTGQKIINSIQKIQPLAIYYIGAWNNYSPSSISETYTSYITKEFITESNTGKADSITSEQALKNKLPLTIKKLEKISKTIVFRPWPTLKKAPNYNVHRVDFLQVQNRRTLLKYSDHKLESKFVNDIFDSQTFINTKFIEPSKIVCENECEFISLRRQMYVDNYHITPAGTFLLKEEILKTLKQ